MIKLGNIDISAFKVGSGDCKVYLGNTLLYPTTPSYDVCYAVVEDISSYTDRTYTDVYEKSSDKWYKLNNLNQYEEYGIYGSGRTITTYDGKLTIDGDYEYQYSGGSWVNVGEVSGSTIDTIWLDPPSTENQYAVFPVSHYWGEGYKMVLNTYLSGSYSSDTNSPWGFNSHTPIEFSFYQNGFYYDFHNPTSTTAPDVYTGDRSWRIMKNNTLGSYENGQILNIILSNGAVRVELESTGAAIVTGSTGVTAQNWYNGLYNAEIRIYNINNKSHLSRIQVYNANNELVNDLKFIKNNGVVGSQEISLYDSILDATYYNNTSYAPSYHIVSESGGTEYPIYYDEKTDPLDNLSFSSMTEAETYAYNNCVYDGMKATINGDRYYFDSTDENGWVKILEYYKFEDVTPGGASGWTISGSSTYNPNPSYYDDFDLETLSTNYYYKIAKVTIYGYENFTYYLRTYGYSTYCYVAASNIDELSTDPTSISYQSDSAITHTYNFNKTAGSAVDLSNYRRVTYNNLDKTVEHTFYVSFYGRTFSSYRGNATILIPKEQTNENWEQVTFSASSNVASYQKNLYIDNNNSTSGGTQNWYYRWIIGLPSGSHSSSTNYSNYNYCPNVTSGTFTSVAGQQRQVNFTYNNTTDKTLSFRLTDGSNVLTPSDTVYYNMTYYNSCGISSGVINTTFPMSQSVKVGGRFRFNSSSNRQYIYGYSPNISLNTDYYVDNYQSTFDITYIKLSEEAVAIAYTTYDPNDVETPSFKTDITWPYNGGTTSSTTLTSYAVPYTYPYVVSQTSDKFSADSQSYKAGQASRTINFVLYPNNREFATVADLEAYSYVWEGMKASVNGTNYTYKNGQWVEQTYTQYEYIRTQNARTIYYDFVTNFKPTNSHTIEVKVEFVDRSIDWGHLVSWYDGTASHGFSFQTVTASYQAIVRTGGDSGTSYRPTIGANNPTVYTLPLSAQSGTYSINGGSPQTIQYNYSTMALPANTGMCFFGKGTTSREKAAVAKMYYVKVYDNNNNLVKHYVPSDYNGTPCFYEIVDGEYIMDTYTGSNHGTLTLGPQI